MYAGRNMIRTTCDVFRIYARKCCDGNTELCSRDYEWYCTQDTKLTSNFMGSSMWCIEIQIFELECGRNNVEYRIFHSFRGLMKLRIGWNPFFVYGNKPFRCAFTHWCDYSIDHSQQPRLVAESTRSIDALVFDQIGGWNYVKYYSIPIMMRAPPKYGISWNWATS